MLFEVTVLFGKSIVFFGVEVVIVSEVGARHGVFELGGSGGILIFAKGLVMVRAIVLFFLYLFSYFVLADFLELLIGFLSFHPDDQLFLAQLPEVLFELGLHLIYFLAKSIYVAV